MNEMSAIRQTLRSAGRNKLADSPQISNKALSINNASRAGTKRAITDTEYQHIHQKALQKNPGFAAAIELKRVLGLRSEEAVQSSQSLQTWQKAINSGETKLTIIFGTKGGRPRETRIIDRERAKNVVNNALNIAEQQNGRLIDKPNLKQAMTYWRNHCSSIGLKGETSPHSLRYAYAADIVKHYQTQGYTKAEAYALTSMDLGHGDGRGRLIKEIYTQKEA